VSASKQANAFCREVLASGEVFMIEHERDGVMTFHLAGDQHARPAWSSRNRVIRMLEGPLAGSGRVVTRLSWHDFVSSILRDAATEGVLIGLNWSGPRARGYNLHPSDVLSRVEAQRRDPNRDACETTPSPELEQGGPPDQRLAG